MVKTGKILRKKIAREIVKSWKQFFAIIAIAGLAVCLFIGLTANYRVFEKRVATLYEDGNIADLWISINNSQVNRIDIIDEKDNLMKIAGVEAVEDRLTTTGLSKSHNIKLMAVNSGATISIQSSIEKGSAGFLIPESFAEKQNIEIGETIVFELPISAYFNEEILTFIDSFVLPDHTNIFRNTYLDLEFVVTGFMTHPECVNATFNMPPYFLTSTSKYEESLKNTILANFQEVAHGEIEQSIIKPLTISNQFVVKVKEEAQIGDVNQSILSFYNNKSNNNLISSVDVQNLATNSGIMSDIDQAKKLTLVFPIVFFLVSILVIMTTISQIILRERTRIGTMKALGLSDTRVLSHYMGLSVTLTLIGSIIGIVIGPLLIPNIMNQKYKLLFALPKMTFVFPFWETLGCIAFIVAVTCLVSYLICRKTMKEMPSDSMRQVVPMNHKKILVSDKVVSTKKGMPLKMAIRNIMVKKSRSLMVIIGVCGCIALLICGFGIEDTLDNGVKNDFDKLCTADIDVTYSAVSTSVGADLAKIDGVTDVEVYTALPTTITTKDASYQTNVRVVQGHQYFKVEFDENKIAISQKVAQELNVSGGDTIDFTVLGKLYSAEIVVVYDAFYYHGILLNASKYPELAAMPTNAWLSIDNAKATEIMKTIDEYSGVAAAMTNTEYRETIADMMSSISLMTNTIKIFAILLAVVVLYNIALLNYKERYKDIATMKVLGFNRFEIASTLIIEIMILTVVGATIGLFLGWPMMQLVLSINETPVVSFLYHIDFMSYFYSFILTIGTAFLINLLLTSMTKNVKMVESLKSYE